MRFSPTNWLASALIAACLILVSSPVLDDDALFVTEIESSKIAMAVLNDDDAESFELSRLEPREFQILTLDQIFPASRQNLRQIPQRFFRNIRGSPFA